MDQQRATEPAPETLREIPAHVRKWLNSIEPEDIVRFNKWSSFIVWFETSGRYTRSLVLFLMSLFGLYTATLFIWGRWTGK